MPAQERKISSNEEGTKEAETLTNTKFVFRGARKKKKKKTFYQVKKKKEVREQNTSKPGGDLGPSSRSRYCISEQNVAEKGKKGP